MRNLTVFSACLGMVCTAFFSPAMAQEVYRSKTASGTVMYSDRALTPGAALVKKEKEALLTDGGFPEALQKSVRRYPVVLFSSPDCAPCAQGRKVLNQRGIPFKEYTIATAEDQSVLEEKGIASLPHLTIGRQALRGFNEAQWEQYLNAAGYPATSLLPEGYQAPKVEPLTVLQKQAQKEAAPASVDGLPDVPNLDPSNPTGIRF
ncbi:glutaredoxin family protein [Allofranklinella schreckenbergeri]|uniref:Glutaredoxin family protein n=1 Tax=Allofranklinella schreckenbergeri TaxID=1076744 RepID=A0A3M6QBY8_9BURK|nr:glutaredoxin domain-containing protein [Allofranklinella schreckenbergeri]RMX00644.1 glutaredoxin family protein [Allofranklinella schreckenbergeri]